MGIPTKLGDVLGMNWEAQTVEGEGNPGQLTLLLPCGMIGEKVFRLSAPKVTLANSILTATLVRQLGQETKVVRDFQIAFDPAGKNRFEVAVPNPKGLALFDSTNQWVSAVKLTGRISISIFLLSKRFETKWLSGSPLIGLAFPNGHCLFPEWRATLWRWFTYLDMVRGVS